MDTIYICCATDANYAPYCGVMLTSVFKNNIESHVKVYILLDSPLPQKEQHRFARLAEKYNNEIIYLLVDKSFLERFPIKGQNYWSIATYYRLYIEKLLPRTVKLILYLDCDIIVDGALDYLWQIDMTNKAIGCVPDIFDYSGHFQKGLNIPIEATYFNAGVLLINLDFWREHSIGQQCLNYLDNHYDIIEANDQDVLNAVLWDKKMKLPMSYNFQIQFLKKEFYFGSVNYQQEIDETRAHPIVIHYAAPNKPWHILYYKMPYKQLWYKYKWASQWWFLVPLSPNRKAFNYILKRYFLWPLGIINYPQYYID